MTMNFYDLRRFWSALPISEKLLWPIVLFGFPLMLLGFAVMIP
jgi:hypothetical protein